MTARHKRATALLLGGLAGLVFTLIAAVQVAGWTLGAVEHTSRQVISGPVKVLTVDAGPGDILILPSQTGDVRVETRSKGTLHTPRIRAIQDGTHVMMSGNCPAFSFGPCEAEVVLHVPVETTVEVHSSSGEITASGVGGPLRLDTNSGDVTAIGVTGPADLHTGSGEVSLRGGSGEVVLESNSGDVIASDVASENVTAETGSGDVNLDFRVPPQMVDAKAGSGDVRVAVPDAASYDVILDTGSGDEQFGFSPDRDSPRKIFARTGSGDATVGYGN